jgi:hypothetical protein
MASQRQVKKLVNFLSIGRMLSPKPSSAFFVIIFAFCFVSCANPLSWGSIPEDLESKTLAEWKEDLAALGLGLASHPKLKDQPDTAARVTTAVRQAVSDLEARGDGDPGLSDLAVAEIYRILALTEDGHTRLNASPRLVYPFIIRFFPKSSAAADLESFEGWEARLAATDEAHEAYLGLAVKGIGSYSLDAAVEKMTDYLPLESAVRSGAAKALLPQAIRNEIIQSFCYPALSRGLGFAPAPGNLSVLIEDPADSSKTITLSFAPEDMSAKGWKTVLQKIPGASRHFTRSRPGQAWWFAQVPGHEDVLYLRYDDCDMKSWPTLNKALSLLPNTSIPGERSTSGAPQRLIVDLRYNSGGNSIPGTRFASRLAEKQLASAPGGVIVLVSSATYSSAMQNAADILKACGASGSSRGRAVLTGEPLVEPLRHYGEVYRFQLPRSGLIVGRSSKLWKYDSATGIYPARAVLEPETENIRVATFDEYKNGEDPIFDMAVGL